MSLSSHHRATLWIPSTGMKFPEGLSGLMRSRFSTLFSPKNLTRSSAEYLNVSFCGTNVITLSPGRRLGYSSNVGRTTPNLPSRFSIKALMSSAAPLPGMMYSGFTPQHSLASCEFTAIPAGYSETSIRKFSCISSIIFERLK